MTRWARAKNPHRHEKQPEQATSWTEFVEQRKSGELQKKTSVRRVKDVKKKVKRETSKDTETKAGEVYSSGAREILSSKNAPEMIKKLGKKNAKKCETIQDTQTETNSMPCPQHSLDAIEAKPIQKTSEIKLKMLGRKKSKSRNKSNIQTIPNTSIKADSILGVDGGEANQNISEEKGKKVKKQKLKKEKAIKAKCVPVQKDPETDIKEDNAAGAAKFEVAAFDDEDVTMQDCTLDKPKKKESKWMKKIKNKRLKNNILLLPPKIERKLYLLKKALRKKRVGGEEIKNIIRRERRRHEIRYRRELSKVCFHCRLPGHMVSDCPNIQADEEQGMDICFKCGSTEHKIYQCPLKKIGEKDFPFAKCFVCGEQGHLSRNCPQNASGVFPKGGSCKLCDSKEHMKKDCPLLSSEKHEDEMYAETRSWTESADAEVIDYKHLKQENSNKKVVKF